MNNDWDDMEDEFHDVKRLDETQVLDASNVRGVTGSNRAGVGSHVQQAHNNNDGMQAAPDKENLKESNFMAFDHQVEQPSAQYQNRLVDINSGHRAGSGLHNMSKLASVNITDFDWKYENFGFGHYEYVVETELKSQAELISVARRYNEFDELYKLLQLEHPGCIIPPLPQKTAVSKLKSKESEESQERKTGLTKFLQLLVEHPWLCSSPILEAFLTDTQVRPFTMASYIQQVDGEFSKAYLLDCIEVFKEEAAIGDFTSQGVSAILQQTNKVFKDTIWGSQKAQMGEAFGEFIEQAKDELSTFKRQEDYLESLEQAYSGLIQSVTAQIVAQEETSQNLVEMAKSFQKVRQMKGAENSQVTQAVCNISNPFNLAATTSNQVAEKMRSEVLSLVSFDLSYLQEAKRTFLRWRALVSRYYVLVNTIEVYSKQLSQMGNSSQAQSLGTESQSKTAERDAIRDVMPAIKQTIIDEIERFQTRFNNQTQMIVQRYTELHRQSAQVQLKYWQDYLSGLQMN